MRNSFYDNINNVISSMANSNQNFMRREIYRLSSIESRSPQYRRNGMYNFGAQQLENTLPSRQFATFGTKSASMTAGQ